MLPDRPFTVAGVSPALRTSALGGACWNGRVERYTTHGQRDRQVGLSRRPV